MRVAIEFKQKQLVRVELSIRLLFDFFHVCWLFIRAWSACRLHQSCMSQNVMHRNVAWSHPLVR